MAASATAARVAVLVRTAGNTTQISVNACSCR
jgi:hypothetical protein